MTSLFHWAYRSVGFLTLIFLILLGAGCTSASKYEEHSIDFSASPQQSASKKLWTKRVPGLLTDLNLSRDGSTALVAVVPDRDSVESSANRSQYFAVWYSSVGKLLAQNPMPAQIKSQSIAEDGSLSIIATYDDQIRAFDKKGKKLWEVEGFCRPIIFSQQKRWVCFHDDDAQPEVAFEVFDFAGHKLSESPIHDDALMLKASSDEKSIILAMTHGKIVIFDSQFKPILKKNVSGEVTDISISNSVASSASTYAILYNQVKGKKVNQRLLIGRTGSGSGSGLKTGDFDLKIPERLTQIELALDGSALFGYSNSPRGQSLVRVDLARVGWKRDARITSEYTSQIAVSQDSVWMGFEDSLSSAQVPHSHVLGFDFSGGLKSTIDVPSEEGALLYTFSASPRAGTMAIGSDDGRLSLFKIRQE